MKLASCLLQNVFPVNMIGTLEVNSKVNCLFPSSFEAFLHCAALLYTVSDTIWKFTSSTLVEIL